MSQVTENRGRLSVMKQTSSFPKRKTSIPFGINSYTWLKGQMEVNY